MRMPTHIKLTLALAATTLIVSPGVALAAQAPIKEIPNSRFGWDVNKTKEQENAPQAERNICTVASKDECQQATVSSEAGGFGVVSHESGGLTREYPSARGVAVDNAPASVSPEHGDVYVTDGFNDRVQVFSPTGAFVRMFGWDVNGTKERAGAPQAERNVCIAESKDVCQAGVEGGASGQFSDPKSLAVDPQTGNVYVEDFANSRVQEFTATGEFVLMIGKDVNESTKENICTAESKNKCKGAERGEVNGTEIGAFVFEQSAGQLLTVGGSENLLYVGDKHRVEIFKTDGTPVGEISLRSISSEETSGILAAAVNQAGDLYASYQTGSHSGLIYEFSPNGALLQLFELASKDAGGRASVGVEAIAVDPMGRIELSEREFLGVNGVDEPIYVLRGTLYEVNGHGGLHALTEGVFEITMEEEDEAGIEVASISFDDEDDMYAIGGNEIVSYKPVAVASLLATGPKCAPGSDNQTDATYECDLGGEVNSEEVSATEAWFQWGKTLTYGTATPHMPVATGKVAVGVSSPLTGLLPDETYYYRLAGEDQNAKAPELLTSEGESFVTPSAAPSIVGEPSVLHAGPFSAVMFGELNPENTNTTYRFQYGACENLESCPGVLETPPVQSPAYGAIATTVETGGLLPETLYHYRLVANNQHEVNGKPEGGEAVSATGTFTTAPGPAVSAQTGAATAVSTTTAVVGGTVNPDGQAASYTFEVGRDAGAETQFGIVSSAPAGAGALPVAETIELSGLQPGTTYAYRISAHSGDGSARGQAATGAAMTFTTQGLPAVLNVTAPLAQLPIPDIAFPAPALASKPKAAPGKTKKKINKKRRRKPSRRQQPEQGHRK